MYAKINAPLISLWGGQEKRKEQDGKFISTVSDEGMYGHIVAVEGNGEMVKVLTHYGYQAYAERQYLTEITEEECSETEKSRYMVLGARAADVTSIPSVQGERLITLFRGAVLEVLDYRFQPGWAKVRLLDGTEGYLRNIFLEPKRFSFSFLKTGILPFNVDSERDFRKRVCNRAKTYEEVQYRWAGKSPLGLDCSGLTSMCYMLEGVLIYRDSEIKEGWPVRNVELRDAKPGDLLYFPGHIALYLGRGRYIHSTGHIDSGGVVYNSLDPKDENYREDLEKALVGVGTVF